MGRAWECACSRLPRQFFCAPKIEKHFSRKKRKKVGIGILEGGGKKNTARRSCAHEKGLTKNEFKRESRAEKSSPDNFV